MRSGADLSLMSGRRRYWAFLEVRDDDGMWKNTANLLGAYDFFVDAEWGEEPDEQVSTATFTLRRNAGGGINLSPLYGGSPINRRADTSFAALVREGHQVKLWTATTDGSVPVSYNLSFQGKIDDVDTAATRTDCVIHCRDMGAYLQKTNIELERIYGSTIGDSIESVKQAIINDNSVPGSPTIITPSSPGWLISPAYKQKRVGVMEALGDLDAQIGWITRYRWNGNTPELRFYRPALKGVADVTFTPSQYISINELKTSDVEVRNVWRVNYVDAAGVSQYVTSVDSASITKYDRQYAEIQESDTSHIKTAIEAQRLADAARDDTSTPYASHVIETMFFWPVETGDLHTYAANGEHYDSDQSLYVSSYRHHLYAGTGRTVISARGKPFAMFRNWLDLGSTDALAAPLSFLDVVATEFATTYSIAWGGRGTITLSIDGGAFATPPTSPIVVSRNPENGATKIYRFRSIYGIDETIETIYVLPIGAVAPPPDLSLTPAAPATLTQSFTVTCTNPRAGGAAPTISAFSIGAGGVVTKPDLSTVALVDGASPITIPSGSIIAMTRPSFGVPSGSLIVRGIIAGGGLAEIQRTITPRQAIGPNLTITPTPFTSTYSIAWTGDGVTLSIDGGTYASPPTSPIIVNRPAIGQPDKVYTFKGTLDGQTVTNTVTIPAVGSPETPNLNVALTSQNDTQITFTVTATSPMSGVVPSIVGFLGDATFADSHTDGGSITSGDTLVINRPVFGNKKDGLLRVRASIGTSYEEITWNIPPQVQTSFGPTLTITPTPFATTYSLYWAGDNVQIDKRDGSGFVTPGASPIVVNRPAVGQPDLVYTFRATKDGQEVTNSITIPAIGSPDTPNLNVVPSANSTTQSFVVTATSATGTPAITTYIDGATYASAHTNGGSVTSGDTVIVNKPTFGNQAGSVRFRAAVGAEFEEIQRTIVTQIKTSFGPSLQLRPIPTTTDYVLYWDDLGSGSTIHVNINGVGWTTPGTSPWTVARPSPGSADDVYAFRAVKDGQTINDSVNVPAIGKTAPTLDVAVTEYADHVSIAFNGTGSTVTYYEDATGPSSATSPLIIYRNAMGGAAKNITLRTVRDGVTLTNTVVVGAIQPAALRAVTSMANYDTPSSGDQEVEATWALTPAVSDATHQVNVDWFKDGAYFASQSAVTPSTLAASTYVISQPNPGSSRFHAVVTLTESSVVIDSKSTRPFISTL